MRIFTTLVLATFLGLACKAPEAPKAGAPAGGAKADPAQAAADDAAKKLADFAGFADYQKALGALKADTEALAEDVKKLGEWVGVAGKVPMMPDALKEAQSTVSKQIDDLQKELAASGTSSAALSAALDQLKGKATAEHHDRATNELKTFTSHFGPVKAALAELDKLKGEIAAKAEGANALAKPVFEALGGALAPAVERYQRTKTLDDGNGQIAKALGVQ